MLCKKYKQLLIIILCCFMHWTSVYGARPYLTLLASECGADTTTVGLISAAYSSIQVVCALLVSRAIDRLGTHRVMICGNALLLVSMLLLTWVRQLELMFLASFLMGLSHIMVMLSAQLLTTGSPSGVTRGRAVGLYTFGNSVGIFFGPIFGAVLFERLGANLGFVGVACTALISLILATLTIDQRRTTVQRHISLREIVANRPLFHALLSSSFVMFVSEINTTFFPLYGRSLGLSVTVIGLILSTFGMASMLIRPFLARLVKWLTIYRLLVSCMLVGGLALAAFGFIRTAGMFLVVGIIQGCALGLLGPTTMLATAELTPQQERSKVFAIRSMINFSGQALSPILFGYVVSAFSISVVYYISGAILAACTRLCVKDAQPFQSD